MFCYHCGNKIDELKSNKNLLKIRKKDETMRIKNEIRKEKDLLDKLIFDTKKQVKSNQINQEQATVIIDEGKTNYQNKVTEIKASFQINVIEDHSDMEETSISYICPRCGHLIKSGFTNEDKKSLARATHAELQRGRNDFARGMCSLILGVILLAIGIIFFLLCRKASNGYQVTTNVAEFWVFLILTIISVILLVLGVVFVFLGLKRKTIYTQVLKDINNETFVQ